jgi:ActR/RegA family two-component response regulator
MKPIRMLIVEDDPALLAGLEEQYREIFTRRGLAVSIEQATTVEKARSLAKQARSEPYDLVSLDVNLGDSRLTGLDVLDTLKRFQSAWMVALLTGVETDATLVATMGETKAGDLRRQLRRDAYARFPAERLLVVEKPSSSMESNEARNLLANRLEQIALVFEEIGRQRYVFRPIEVTSLERVPQPRGSKGTRKFIETTSLHWQIRYDCGEIRTLPNLSGFKTLHYLLSRDRNESIRPEEALAIEPKTEKSAGKPESGSDPVAEYFQAQGIAWVELSPDDQSKLIRAALSLKFNRYCELRAYQDDEDLAAAEEAELQRIVRELGPLADAAETGYLRMNPDNSDQQGEAEPSIGFLSQDDLHQEGGNYDKFGENRRGKDSPTAALFRARMKRVRDCLRENGFANLAQHLEDFVMSTGANWSYNPPEGVEWTT